MQPTIQLNGEQLKEFLKYYEKLSPKPTSQAQLDAEVRHWYKNVYERNNNLAAYKPTNAWN